MSLVVTAGQLVAFGAACVVLIAVPGPAVLFVVGRSLSLGTRSALLSLTGNAAGNYAVATAVAFGLGPVLERASWLLTVAKFAGAVFLCWLGLHAILAHRRPRSAAPDLPRPAGTVVTLRQGFTVGVTNPKALVVFAIIMPPFLHVGPEAGLPAQMLVLSVVPVAIGLVTDTTWALCSAAARSWFDRSPARERVLGRVGGVLMVGLGVATAVE